MAGSGSSIYSSIEDFEAGLPLEANFLQLQPGPFRGRITWIELPRVRLLFVREGLPRIAYITPPPDHVLIVFPTHRRAPLICDGICLRWGDVIIYKPGDSFHQRTKEAAAWGAISMAPSTLRSFGRLLLRRKFDVPSDGFIWRPCISDRKELLALHRQAMRLAESALDRVAHPEIVRALENDLAVTAVRSLADGDVRDEQNLDRGRAQAMRRLEDFLATPRENLRVQDVHDAVGLTKARLQTYSRQVLGLSVARYVQLRRLKQLRRVVLSAASPAEAVEVVKQYGFSDLERFGAAYCRAFGVDGSCRDWRTILSGSGRSDAGRGHRPRR